MFFKPVYFLLLLQFATPLRHAMVKELATVMVLASARQDTLETIARNVPQTTTLIRHAHVSLPPYSFVFDNHTSSFSFLDCSSTDTCHAHGVCSGAGKCLCDDSGYSPTSNCSGCAANYYNYPLCTRMPLFSFHFHL